MMPYPSRVMLCVIAISLFLVVGGVAQKRSGTKGAFHVSPTGSAKGDGSRERPWDLRTALAHPAVVKPGNTIWLHHGTYKGSFRSDLRGREGNLIVVRQAVGERAIVDLEPDPKLGVGFYAYGEWTRFQGFEVTCSNPKRRTMTKGSWPSDLRRGSVEGRGSHLQFVNLIVHDLGSGFGFWSEGKGGEVYGCLIYNNGWGAPDRGHGHGIYAQNKEGVKTISDNFLFHQFGGGMHVYGSDKAFLQGFRIVGNVVFHNGCLDKPGQLTRSILVGGGAPLKDVVVRENMIYNGGLQVGYSSEAKNESVVARKNYVRGMSVSYQGRLEVTDNTIFGSRPVLSVTQTQKGTLADHKIDSNVYYNTEPKHLPFSLLVGEMRNRLTLKEWRQRGFDANSQFHGGPPKAGIVFVRPNKYEPGRANVIVFDWDRKPEVSLDVKDVLEVGQRFRIVSARNFHGPTLVSGTYRGKPIALPMKPIAPVQPVGMPDYELPKIEPEFGVYVVLPE